MMSAKSPVSPFSLIRMRINRGTSRSVRLGTQVPPSSFAGRSRVQMALAPLPAAALHYGLTDQGMVRWATGERHVCSFRVPLR
jgi:hypothetical protein